ncbi:PA2169 family four-helix-bundle protein [Flavihumibacter sp. R14]|nr:PA2169 family four-helix-bundle protein [Flavihumibacter soli]
MESIENSVEILNDLVEINNDRIVGYERAIEETETEDADLKSIFTQMASESRQYKQELTEVIAGLGGEIETGTTASGKIYRAWMDVKATFSGNSRKSVLENCEFGEDAAQKAYRMALADEDLSSTYRELVMRQQQALKLSHDKIKLLRDQQ